MTATAGTAKATATTANASPIATASHSACAANRPAWARFPAPNARATWAVVP